MGDFQALIHGAVGTDWYGTKIHDIKIAKFLENKGRIKVGAGSSKNQLLINPNRGHYKNIMQELPKNK